MGLSVNEFIYAGANEFTLNFAMGYTSRSDVTAYKEGDPNVDLSFDWLTDNQVRLVSGQALVSGDIIVFRRTVSKQSLPVDLTQPGEATRENLETMFKHAVYVAHEVLDERADFIPSNELVLPVSKGGTGANNSTGAALNLGILAGINILAPENNLSDLADPVEALVNLGVTATAGELNALDGVTTWGRDWLTLADAPAAVTALDLGLGDLATQDTVSKSPAVITAAGASSYSFTDLPTGINEFKLAIYGASSSGEDDLMIRLGPSTGPATTGYVSSTTSESTSAWATNGLILYLRNSAISLTGVLNFVRLAGTNTWTLGGSFTRGASSSGAAGGVTLSDELSQVQILTSSGNSVDAGTICLRYII